MQIFFYWFNFFEVALIYHLYYPTFSSLRCGECGVLWGFFEAVYPLRGISLALLSYPMQESYAEGVNLSREAAFTSPRLGAKRRTWGGNGYRVGTSERFTYL